MSDSLQSGWSELPTCQNGLRKLAHGRREQKIFRTPGKGPPEREILGRRGITGCMCHSVSAKEP
jgi:hypothetical protein